MAFRLKKLMASQPRSMIYCWTRTNSHTPQILGSSVFYLGVFQSWKRTLGTTEEKTQPRQKGLCPVMTAKCTRDARRRARETTYLSTDPCVLLRHSRTRLPSTSLPHAHAGCARHPSPGAAHLCGQLRLQQLLPNLPETHARHRGCSANCICEYPSQARFQT